MDEKYYVYIIYSSTSDRYYVGHTNHVIRRLNEHNDPLANHHKYCSKNGPWELKFYESGFSTRNEAVNREKQIKAWKSRKKIEILISQSKCTISSVGIPI